jgi:hypothetical protein
MGLASDPIEAEGALSRRGRPTTERPYGFPNPVVARRPVPRTLELLGSRRPGAYEVVLDVRSYWTPGWDVG